MILCGLLGIGAGVEGSMDLACWKKCLSECLSPIGGLQLNISSREG